MQPENRDIAYLWDMRQASVEILEMINGISFVEFERNRTVRYAVERQLEIVGEAARRISDQLKETHREIPWTGIIGLRNIIAHEYGEIVVERIWITATERVPQLISLIDPLIPPPPEE